MTSEGHLPELLQSSSWIKVDRQIKGFVLVCAIAFSSILFFVFTQQPTLLPPREHPLASKLTLDITQNSSELSRVLYDFTRVPRAEATAVGFQTLPPVAATELTNADDLRNNTVEYTAGYVTLCSKNFDGRRLGNQLFNFAAMLHVARLTGRRPAMIRSHPDGWIDQWFDASVHRIDDVELDLCPCSLIGDQESLWYDSTVRALRNWTRSVAASSGSGSGSNETLLVCGWTQSWRFTVGIERQLRERYLRPVPSVADSVRAYLERIRPRRWSSPFVRIGIHVRVGDVGSRYQLFLGYTVPGRAYFERAMRYMIGDLRATDEGQGDGGLGAAGGGGGSRSDDSLKNVQFVVISDSIEWCRTTLNLTTIADELRSPDVDVDLVYSDENRSAGFDMVTLMTCDALIITTGSYGWWAAWLANKTTIYYANWPRPGSPLAGVMVRDDFFPEYWIPIDGPYSMF